MESGVHSSLHPNRYHQIVFAKTNLKIYYPPPYEHEIWHYEKANADLIRRSIDQLPWDIRFAHIGVNQKVYLFNQTIKTFYVTLYHMRLSLVMIVIPPWITSKIKGLIQKKNIAKKCYFQNKEDIQLIQIFQNIQKLLTAAIEKSKE